MSSDLENKAGGSSVFAMELSRLLNHWWTPFQQKDNAEEAKLLFWNPPPSNGKLHSCSHSSLDFYFVAHLTIRESEKCSPALCLRKSRCLWVVHQLCHNVQSELLYSEQCDLLSAAIILLNSSYQWSIGRNFWSYLARSLTFKILGKKKNQWFLNSSRGSMKF